MSRSILIDADVISHFITAGKLNLLPKIFPENKIFLIDKVYAELERSQKRKQLIDNMIKSKSITILPFPEDSPEIKREYAYIKKDLFKGDGESACMAVARYNNDIIASSNLKDIRQYCQLHSIDYLATMDFLCAALYGHLLTINECNEFISKVIRCGSKLPVLKIELYQCRDIGFIGR
jgi:predicted nucleic acid-binding protein